MGLQRPLTSDPSLWLAQDRPDEPILFFDPVRLCRAQGQFRAFPGEVTYAVKANPSADVLTELARGGMTAFDVASPEEMALVRSVAPEARLHYHNPVRSRREITEGRRFGCASWSVDRMGELDKLGRIERLEIAVRLKLPVTGAAYDFGAKFGAAPEAVADLLRAVVARGGKPSITFHPGTQCPDPRAWVRYIEASAQISRDTGIALHRLNVGGGFPAHRDADAPDLTAIFEAIRTATQTAFETPPPLVCEPGRAMVAESHDLALRVKAISDDAVFLNDGIYGGLSEWRDLGASPRIRALTPEGTARQGALRDVTVFGPTCDSLDRLPGRISLPQDLSEGDYLLFNASGAYSSTLATRFNGYGVRTVVTLKP